MCAIYGYLDPKIRRQTGEGILAGMAESLRHRGPDGQGVYVQDGFGFGHSRLAVVGLENGRQPIAGPSGGVQIVCAGEIFNYPELKKELEAKGRRFQTLSDSEVVAHLFEEEGMDFVEKLNGQFAIAVWDAKNSELHLVRDRFGIVPLYYAVQGNAVIFASEIKGILRYPGIEAVLEPRALEQVFTFWSPLPGQTMFRGIRELRPGRCLKIRSGEVLEKTYWELSFGNDTPEKSTETLAEELRALLADSVKLRLRADVPVGAYVSGGLDSSAIAAIAHRDRPALETFSLKFQDRRYDESASQEFFSASLGIKNYGISGGPVWENFFKAVRHAETPLLRTAPAPLLRLSAFLKERRLKVALSGEGADEFFLGYEIFKELKIREFCAREPSSRKRTRLLNRLYPDLPFIRSLDNAYLKRAFLADAGTDPLSSHRARWGAASRLKKYFSGDFRAALSDYDVFGEVSGSLPSAFGSWDSMGRAQYLEASLFLGGYLLSSQGDRMAMANGVELRHPYLDHRVVEFADRLPAHVKMAALHEKSLLKKAVASYLPERILSRAKKPYRAPSFASEGARWKEIFAEDRLKRSGYFDPAETSRLVKKAEAKGGDLSEVDAMALCGIASAQIFHETFLEGRP